MSGRVVQRIYGSQVKTINVSTRIDVVYYARFVNLVEETFGVTVMSSSAAIRAVVCKLVDDAESGLNEVDVMLKEGGIGIAQEYLISKSLMNKQEYTKGKGLVTRNTITQGDRATHNNISHEYEKLKLSGKGGAEVDLSSLAGLNDKEKRMMMSHLAKMASDPEYAEMQKKKEEEMYQEICETESGAVGEEGPDVTKTPLIVYKGKEAERMEKKARSWARNPEFDGYDDLTGQMKTWFDDERRLMLIPEQAKYYESDRMIVTKGGKNDTK